MLPLLGHDIEYFTVYVPVGTLNIAIFALFSFGPSVCVVLQEPLESYTLIVRVEELENPSVLRVQPAKGLHAPLTVKVKEPLLLSYLYPYPDRDPWSN